jgi:hypothetical protein
MAWTGRCRIGSLISVRVGSVGSGMTNFRKWLEERKKKRKSKLDIKWPKKSLKKSKLCPKVV